VVAYIAVHRPAAASGHRGDRRSSSRTAAKKEALQAAGVTVVAYPTEIGEAVAGLL
jgi:succinyl-CoA synthetase alpha subunit